MDLFDFLVFLWKVAITDVGFEGHESGWAPQPCKWSCARGSTLGRDLPGLMPFSLHIKSFRHRGQKGDPENKSPYSANLMIQVQVLNPMVEGQN